MTVDLRTTYLGIELHNPLVVSACPLSQDIDTLKSLEANGAAAAVFPSLFEEQIEQEEAELHALHEFGTESFAESVTYLPSLNDYNVGPEGYLTRLEQAKRSVNIPIIGSLNGASTGGWIEFARRIQDAGADALELNICWIPADPATTGEDVERLHVQLVHDVRRVISIPLAVKIVPFFSSMANMARRLFDAGADGLVLFNRFVHPDIDLETLQIVPKLHLSSSVESALPRTWIALLRGGTDRSLAATGGAHTPDDAIKLLLAGADVVMVASSLYQQNTGHMHTLLEGVRQWLTEREYESVQQMKGSMSQANCPDPVAFERVGYMRTITSFSG